MKVLVATSSKHGSTAEIAGAIGSMLRGRDMEPTITSPELVGSVTEYDAVILGSAVYAGRWMKPIRDMVDRLGDQLAERLQHFAVNLVILDQDAQAILQFGQHARDRHRVQLGQRTEQRRVRVETVHALGRQTQHIGQYAAHCRFHLPVCLEFQTLSPCSL